MHPDLIYDIGMHNGQDTAYYLHKGFRVVAVEANPLLVAQAMVRFRQAIDAGRLTILSCGITATHGKAPFYICQKNSAWSSFDAELARQLGPTQVVEVDCLPLSDIFRKHGTPYYLKIDIEGSDQLCLRDIPNDDPPTYVSAEFTDLATLLLMRQRGYRGFKCILQNNFNALNYDPANPSRDLPSHWQWVDTPRPDGSTGQWQLPSGADGWSFPFGSSGPFAEDTPGPWLSFEQAAFTFLAQKLGHATTGANWWLDLHATRQEIPVATKSRPTVTDTLCQTIAALTRQLDRPPRIWIFGAGRHTQRLLAQKELWLQNATLLGLIDDNAALAPPNDTCLGLPVRSRKVFESMLSTANSPDAVILSSDTFEDTFWTLTASIRDRGVPVFRLYAPTPIRTSP
jgi:FkbM family methyltransferase